MGKVHEPSPVFQAKVTHSQGRLGNNRRTTHGENQEGALGPGFFGFRFQIPVDSTFEKNISEKLEIRLNKDFHVFVERGCRKVSGAWIAIYKDHA